MKHLNKKNISYPENITSLIIGVLEKYGLAEDSDTIVKKISSQEKLNSEIIAEIIKKNIEEKIPFKELLSYLAKELKISQKLAKDIENEIQEKIIPLIRVRDKLTEKEIPQEEVTGEKEEFPRPSKIDIYREPIE